MSYDLHVYGMRALPPAEFKRLIESVGGIRARIDRTSGAILEVVGRGNVGHLFTVDGPFDVDPEDLEGQPVAVRQARTLYSFVTSGSSELGISAAIQVAGMLASEIGGSVVDPQDTEEPVPSAAPVDAAPVEQKQKQYLHLVWYRARDGRSDLAQEFLAAAREFFPPAVPARFGTYEPMQGKLPRDDDTEFDRIYREEAALGGMFFTGKGVRGRMSGWSNDFVARIEVAWLHIDLASLSRANAARVKPFFENVARRAECDYAVANVKDWRSWSPRVMAGGIWAGVSPEPVWMTWCSREYAAMLRPHFTSGEITDRQEGLLHQWTPEPTSSEQLIAHIDGNPWVAPELIATFDPQSDEIVERAWWMPERLRPRAPDSPEARRIEANIARNRAAEQLI